VAAKSLLLPVRVLAAAQALGGGPRVGVGSLADIDAGLKVAVDLGADIINMSFGTPASAVPAGDALPHSRVIPYALHHGCTLVAAAGNKGDQDKYYPSALPGVIAVGSLDARNRRSHFSSFGEHLCVSAPGEQIFGLDRGGYRANSGTSFASPFVAGVAALVVTRSRRLGMSLDGSAVRRILMETAKTLQNGFNPETGHGMVDALAALRRVDAMAETSRTPRRS
jgi:subtilisin family serine protease